MKSHALILTTALAGLAAAAFPARAEMHIELGGYIRSYLVYADNDEGATPAATDDSLRKFEFKREIEVHLNGEKKLDNGLTLGIHAELELANESLDGTEAQLVYAGRDPAQFDEAFAYFSGAWGRVNLGAHSGAAFLLQVAAPAADGNVDGLRVNMQGFTLDAWDDGLVNASFAPKGAYLRLNYDNTDIGITDRITYLTPKWNGLQAGVSYAPHVLANEVNDAFAGMQPDDRPGRPADHRETGLRWDGKLGEIRVAAGAGYAFFSPETRAAPGANGSDDMKTWDVGLNLGYREFSLGGAYRKSNTAVSGPASDARTWIAGVAWDRLPWHLGATWYSLDLEANAYSIGLADSLKLDRYTAGGWYALGPGTSLRATVSFLDVDNGANAPRDPQQVQATFGTQVEF